MLHLPVILVAALMLPAYEVKRSFDIEAPLDELTKNYNEDLVRKLQ